MKLIDCFVLQTFNNAIHLKKLKILRKYQQHVSFDVFYLDGMNFQSLPYREGIYLTLLWR